MQSPDPQYLSLEESADIDSALLDSSEKFLTRLTVSSLRLLKQIATDLDISIEELNHKQIIEWMEEDSKTRREQGKDKAKLNW